MMMRFSVAFLSLVGSATAFDSSSVAGQHLLSQSRRLADNGGEEQDLSFISSYDIKWQGCHHVQQWNDEANGNEDDVRIKTKRLARYRLCPTGSCSDENSSGCTSKFGDYVVDMETFLAAYYESAQQDKEQMCEATKEDCEAACGGNDDDCMASCYDGYEMSYCLENDADNNNSIDVAEYTTCNVIDLDLSDDAAGDDANDVQYYVGPYCSSQGGEILLGVFTDDTCTTFAANGTAHYQSVTGAELPYSVDSLVSSRCVSCLDNSNDDGNKNSAKDLCDEIYQVSGKCETRMSIDYPNESSCGYIEGIKIIRNDGIIRTSATRKSKGAAVAIGVFMTTAILLAGYVYYLRTKLSRAQINLAAASQPLT